MTEATPRPWEWHKGTFWIRSSANAIVAETGIDVRPADVDDRILEEQAEANAALIVKAVNLHDELVEALERIQTFNEAECDILGGIGDQVAAVLQKAREA